MLDITFGAGCLDVRMAALEYAESGLSVIPVRGKKAIGAWSRWQHQRASYDQIHQWGFDNGEGVAVVLGAISGVVVIDLDGLDAIQIYDRTFPHLTDTFAVTSGSGTGRHYYYIPTEGQWNTTKIKGFELRGNGAYVVAPPSLHPSGRRYTVAKQLSVMPANLTEVRVWIAAQQVLKRDTPPPSGAAMSAPAATHPTPDNGWSTPRIKAYVNGAKEREYRHVAGAGTGERNNSIYHAARRLAALAANPDVARHCLLTHADIFRLLEAAGAAYADSDGYAALCRTINSGLRTGAAQPARLPR